jgi:radical SAM protein (TIGR01212 family)
MNNRYNDLNSWLRARFGCRVQKISLDAGLGCPNRDGTRGTGGCIYCNERGSGTGASGQGLSITEQLVRGKESLGKRYKARKFIAYFQSFTNTYAPFDKLKSLYDEALAVEDVVGMSVGTRPDCIETAVLDMLAEHARRRLVWIEYGLQSIHDRTLRSINRGHDAACFRDAVERTKGRGIGVHAHVVIGLPGESRADMLATARAVAEMGIDGIKVHLLYVVKGTGMEKLYCGGGYRCLEQEEYAEIVADFLEALPPEMVIQRLTGDPHPGELVAPLWCLDKTGTLKLIGEILERRGSRQGSAFVPSRPLHP